jgi:hypothetical protein
MWTRDAFDRGLCCLVSVDMHIYEKKKLGQRADSPASSFSKYAKANGRHCGTREGCS